jgi:hypothetical protein
MRPIALFLLLMITMVAHGQTGYRDSMATFLRNYVQTHEVIKGHDKEHMSFFEIDPGYRIVADFTASASADWIRFKTSGKEEKVYRVFGTANFHLNGQAIKLNIYQSQNLMASLQYKNYLFLPFTDSTSGNETYSGGRYLDLSTNDIRNGKLVLDFNKAYNPYCAYVSGVYNCPIPPKENALPVAIRAGEKTFNQSH